MKITKKEIEENCKRTYLEEVKLYFKTYEFKRWVNQCIDLARENNNLIE